MFGLGIGEGLILLVVVLLLFGGKKLPELGSSMGKALTNFKKGMNDANNEASDPEKIEQNQDDNTSNQA
jgi:sec-independent protein translocase protein TatA